jgi:hypothetical protein
VLHASEADLKAHDRAEQRAPISKRKHSTRKARLLRDLLQRLFNGNLHTTLERADIETAMAEFLGLFGDELPRLFGRRSDKSKDPLAIARWLLAKMHLKLDSEQVMKNGQRIRVYHLDGEQLALWQDLAAKSWQHRQDEPPPKKAITQNRYVVVPQTTESKQSLPLTLDQLDHQFETAVRDITDPNARQVALDEFLKERRALECEYRTHGYVIPCLRPSIRLLTRT